MLLILADICYPVIVNIASSFMFQNWSKRNIPFTSECLYFMICVYSIFLLKFISQAIILNRLPSLGCKIKGIGRAGNRRGGPGLAGPLAWLRAAVAVPEGWHSWAVMVPCPLLGNSEAQLSIASFSSLLPTSAFWDRFLKSYKDENLHLRVSSWENQL